MLEDLASSDSPLPNSWADIFLVCLHMAEWAGNTLGALIPFLKVQHSKFNHLPKVPLPITITLRIRFQHMNSDGTQTFSLQHSPPTVSQSPYITHPSTNNNDILKTDIFNLLLLSNLCLSMIH